MKKGKVPKHQHKEIISINYNNDHSLKRALYSVYKSFRLKMFKNEP